MKIKYSDIEKAFMMKSISPFDILEDRELFNIASVATVKQFSPRENIQLEHEMSHEVFLVIDGSVASLNSNEPVKIIGIKSVLDDTIVTQSLIAGDDGATCLRIGKGHFLTAIYECPAMLVKLTDIKKSQQNYYI